MMPPRRWLGIERSELRWVMLTTTAVMAVTCLPYLLGYAIAPPGMHFQGLIYNPDDPNVYLSWMRQASEDHLTFSDLFTTEPHPANLFNVFFLSLGLISRWLHLPLILAYHLARVVFGWLVLVTIYGLATRVCDTVPARRIAWTLTATAAGLGWLLSLTGGPQPVDFARGLIMPEAITFLTVLLNPLFCISLWLILISLLLLQDSIESGHWEPTIWAGVALLILSNIHSYDIITVTLILVTWGVVLLVCRGKRAWKSIVQFAVAGAIAAPAVLHQYLALKANPVFKARAVVPTLSPPPLDYALGFGLPLLLALPAVWWALRKRREAHLLLLGWTIACAVAVYLPVPFQRKLAESWQVPICLLAGVTLGYMLTAWRNRVIALALTALSLIIAPISNLFFLNQIGHNLVTNNRDLPYLMSFPYLSDDELAAASWLERHRSQGAVLCGPWLGNYLPRLAGARVYLGHFGETSHFSEKLHLLRWFLRADVTNNWREELLRRAHIAFVLYGPLEQVMGIGGPRLDFRRSPLLRPVYHRGQITIYHTVLHQPE